MKLGLGLYRQILTTENFRFARQAVTTYFVTWPSHKLARRQVCR